MYIVHTRIRNYEKIQVSSLVNKFINTIMNFEDKYDDPSS